MPTYEYRCAACGHEVEFFQSIREARKRKCPNCGKQRLQRRIGTGAGIVFKGGGFYQTDYRSESYKQQAAKEAQGGGGEASGAGQDGKTEGKTDGKADAQPAAKKDAKKPPPRPEKDAG